MGVAYIEVGGECKPAALHSAMGWFGSDCHLEHPGGLWDIDRFCDRPALPGPDPDPNADADYNPDPDSEPDLDPDLNFDPDPGHDPGKITEVKKP